jgi:hypothetical protein
VTGDRNPTPIEVAQELRETRDDIESHWNKIKALTRRESELMVTLALMRDHDMLTARAEERGAE